tara:strand:+ start:260 stop:487 length:228 start_codon:yes stop_codon:yes gene_type:complete
MIERLAIWLIFVFGIIYWFQYIDDKKKNIKRCTTERLKFPFFVALMIGITINIYDIDLIGSYHKELEVFTEQANF